MKIAIVYDAIYPDHIGGGEKGKAPFPSRSEDGRVWVSPGKNWNSMKALDLSRPSEKRPLYFLKPDNGCACFEDQ